MGYDPNLLPMLEILPQLSTRSPNKPSQRCICELTSCFVLTKHITGEVMDMESWTNRERPLKKACASAKGSGAVSVSGQGTVSAFLRFWNQNKQKRLWVHSNNESPCGLCFFMVKEGIKSIGSSLIV